MMKIRQATLVDIPEIVAMARKFYATTSYEGWAPFNPDTVAELSRALAKDHIMLVADNGHGLVGMAGLFVTPFMFNADRLSAHEVVWWVDPEAQGAGVGKALLRSVVEACATLGCNAVQMVRLKSSPPQAAMIYERAGFHETEISHTRVL